MAPYDSYDDEDIHTLGQTKVAWISRAQQVPAPTLFHEPWWLHAATAGRYCEVSLPFDGRIVGRLPYVAHRKRTGHLVLGMPPMTHVLGPALCNGINPYGSVRSLKRFTVTRDLIARLPQASHIRFQLHADTTDTLAFEAIGFQTTVNFTTEIAPQPTDILWGNLRDKTRNVIRRAEDILTVTPSDDFRGFLDFYEANLRERGLHNKYSRRACEAVMTACRQNSAGQLLIACDVNGEMTAGIFTVWDSQREYYLMSSRTLPSPNGAVSLLIWTALKNAAANVRTFDTDGVNPDNLLLLSGFGGVMRPRFVVTKSTLGYRIAKGVHDGLQGRRPERGFLARD